MTSEAETCQAGTGYLAEMTSLTFTFLSSCQALSDVQPIGQTYENGWKKGEHFHSSIKSSMQN